MEKLSHKNRKQSTKIMEFRSDKIFKMETVQASRCFKTLRKRKDKLGSLNERRKKITIARIHYLLQHRTQSRIKKNVYPANDTQNSPYISYTLCILFAQF